MTTQTETTAPRAVVTAFIHDLFTTGDLSAVDRYLDPAYLDHTPPMNGPSDREGMRHAGATFRHACPDWHSDILLLTVDGDLVTEHFRASGTHQNELLGVPGTGRTLTLMGTHVFRVRNGKITERWGTLDELGLLRGLGLVPHP
jgi:predicted ester cyclase